MKITWHITKSDIRAVKDFIKTYRATDFVQRRIDHNLGPRRSNTTKSQFWRALMMGLVTTQQRSGPTSPVSRFLKTRPFPLSYRACSNAPRLKRFAARTLAKHRLRRSSVIADETVTNLEVLSSHSWQEIRQQLRALEGGGGAQAERKAANLLAANLKGVGPKQSRNIPQSLGLTRYEIPLDSRITKWLNNFGFPMKLGAAGLQDPSYYELVLDGVQALCRKARVYPCVLDAAIFVSFDEPAEA